MTRKAVQLDAVSPGLAGWVEAALGGPIARCERTPTGGSRLTFLVDVARREDVLPVVVRTDACSFAGTELSLAREAVAYRALDATAVPSPAVLAEREDGSCVILERLPGTDDLAALDPPERAAAMAHFIEVLATLHQLDPAGLELPGFEWPTEPEDHARLDIGVWLRIADGLAAPDPLLAYAGGWLLANAPTRATRTSFVQGDTGPGNFLVRDGRVTGLVDLEFAHVGDPMDDLAWLLMRTRSSYEDAADLLGQYERCSGIAIDESSVRYYRVAVDYRCAITTSLTVERRGGARGFAPYLLATQRYLDGLARRLAELTGVPVPAELSPAPVTARDSLFGELLDDVRRAARALDDDNVRTRTRDAQILVHHLRACDRFGDVVEREDVIDRDRSLGTDVDDDELTRIAGLAGEEDDRSTLAYLVRRQQRRNVLWQPLLDRTT